MIIWCDKPKATIKRKGLHCVKKGQSKLKLKSGFFHDCGDVPVCIIESNSKIVSIKNLRGNAYAHRNALRYRNKISRSGSKQQFFKNCKL
jgi:ssDNA-binding Zn-finger/Zn-ribbon topoisomerase 1